jgi:hypothetical protein
LVAAGFPLALAPSAAVSGSLNVAERHALGPIAEPEHGPGSNESLDARAPKGGRVLPYAIEGNAPKAVPLVYHRPMPRSPVQTRQLDQATAGKLSDTRG